MGSWGGSCARWGNPEASGVPSRIGFVGLVVFVAGLYMIWQARGSALFWLEEFFRILQASLRQSEPRSSAWVRVDQGTRNKDTLRLVGGLGLAFIGQILVLLDLAF